MAPPGLPRHRLRRAHPYGAPAAGHRRLHRRARPREGRALLPDLLPPREREAPRRRRRHARRGAQARRGPLRRLGEGRRARRRRWPSRPAPAPRTFYLVDKPGAAQSVIRIGHVGVPRSTPDYYALRVLNTILGGVVHLAAQPEPARDARLHLRRVVGVRHVPHGRAVPRRRLGADREDRQRADRVLQGAAPHPRRAGAGGRAGQGQGLHRLGLPGEFETTQGAAGHVPRPARQRPAARLLRRLHPEDQRRDRRGRAARGAAYIRPGPLRGRGGRRPQPDRGAASRR